VDQDIKTRASRIKLLILDVDGVLTAGSLLSGPEGEAIKTFNAHDGAGIKWLLRAGVEVAIMTGRDSPQVSARAKELGIETVIQDAKKKLPAFEKFLSAINVPPENIAFMGDDLLDLPVLRRVGLSMAPADARPEVRQAVDWVAPVPGGHGAVREACELILKAIGKWEEIIAPYAE